MKVNDIVRAVSGRYVGPPARLVAIRHIPVTTWTLDPLVHGAPVRHVRVEPAFERTAELQEVRESLAVAMGHFRRKTADPEVIRDVLRHGARTLAYARERDLDDPDELDIASLALQGALRRIVRESR